MILLLVLLLVGVASAGCTNNDRRIWEREGHTWAHRFRDFGGLFVSTSSYEDQVRQATGLSEACAHCYGVAYDCGFSECKWRCASEGPSCTECLIEAQCIQHCNECTGFQ